MQISDIQVHLEASSKNATEEFKRLFHGRGGLYEGWKHLTVDSINDILSVALYFEEENEKELLEMLLVFTKQSRYKTLLVQRRYLKGSPSEILLGELQDDLYILENGVKIKLNLLSNKNSGYFPDMKKGREFVRENAKDKRVLNLFSYTCAFSLVAKMGGAYEVVNVDMSKGALKTGMANHSLNGLDPRGTSYLSYNILKSFYYRPAKFSKGKF
jgi:23S rRNA (cytosine1962-C5)-methyltransferase